MNKAANSIRLFRWGKAPERARLQQGILPIEDVFTLSFLLSLIIISPLYMCMAGLLQRHRNNLLVRRHMRIDIIQEPSNVYVQYVITRELS